MKQKQTYMLREQTESRRDKVAVCWWNGQSYDVSIWWTTEARRERPDGRQAKMRADTKPKKTREDRNEVVGFHWIGICLVFRGNPVWYRVAIYIVISYEVSHIMRYHKIRYIEIAYPYSEFLGLISKYRIPSKYFSIPNTRREGSCSIVRRSTLNRHCTVGRTLRQFPPEFDSKGWLTIRRFDDGENWRGITYQTRKREGGW